MKTFAELFKDWEVEGDMSIPFKTVAEQLMQGFVLCANKKEFLLTEIEFYLFDPNNHKDTFAHAGQTKNDRSDARIRQQEMGQWYFHYSGIDLTFGKDGWFGGILLRELYDIEEKKYITGPLKLKNYLLNEYTDFENANLPFLHLKPYDVSNQLQEIKPQKRYGLGKAGNEEYRERAYAFKSVKKS
jgi:hypothetical protein